MGQFQKFVFVVSVVACCSAAVLAQSSTDGSIVGRVIDQSGAAVPHVRVEAIDVRSGALAAGESGWNGEFRLPALEPDAWRLRLSARGFETRETTPVTVTLGGVADAGDLVLHVGAVPELKVEVTAATLLETQSAEVTTLITPEEVEDLPVNAQRWQNFLLLTPTAVVDPETNSVSFHAAPSTQNTELLDGADTTRQLAPGNNASSRVDATISRAAVREFRAVTQNWSMAQGRSVGGVVETVTRSGGNHVHGEGTYYARDSEWSNIAPAAPVVLPQPDGTLSNIDSLPRDWRQQGSLRVGGPIVRDRAFWHLTGDYQRRSFPAIGTVSDAPGLFYSQALPGDLSGFEPQGANCQQLIYTNVASTQLRGTGSETTAALYGTQGACYLNLFDSVDYPSYAQASAAYNNGLAYLYSLAGEVPRARETTLVTPEADAQFGRTHLLTAYTLTRSNSSAGAEQQPYVARSISSLGNDKLQEDRVSAAADTALTYRAVNSLRLGFSRVFDAQTLQAPLPQEPLTALGGAAPVGVSIARQFSFGTLPSEARGAYPREHRTQVYDAVTYSRGSHTLTAGGEWQHTTDEVQQLYAEAGQYHYSNVQDFLIDAATTDSVADVRCGVNGGNQHNCYSWYQQGFGAPGASFAVNDWAAFVQEQWRITPRLNVHAGLRYDYERLPPPSLANPLLPGSGSAPGDSNNFGPRAGVAWQPWQRTVVHAGAGIYYGRTPATLLYNAQIATAAPGSQQVFDVYSAAAGLRYPNTLPAPPADSFAPNVTVFARNFQQPQVAMFNLEVQQQFGERNVLTFGGVAVIGRELPIVVDTNLNTPSSSVTYNFTGGPLDGKAWTVPVYTGARPDTNFGAIHTVESRANSQYSGMVVQFERRAANSLTLRTNYTWSHAMDDGERSRVTGLSNQVLSPDDFGLQHGTSSLDRRQRLAGSAVWEPMLHRAPGWGTRLANNWLVAPVLQVASGVPFSARLLGEPPGGSPTYRTSYGYLGAGGDDFLPLLGRNHYTEPATAVLDLRVARRITFAERLHAEVFADFFNLANRTNVTGSAEHTAVDDDAYQIGSGQTPGQPVLATYRPTFGSIVEQDSEPLFTQRQLQFGARLSF